MMRCLLVIAVLIFATQTSAGIAVSASETLPEKVRAALESAGIPPSNVAIFIQAVTAETPTLLINPAKSMNPASLMKLVTTEAGLEMLRPDYRWKTEVYLDGKITGDGKIPGEANITDGEIVGGTLKGNLILKGYGDPSFNEAAFRRLLVRVRQAGVQKIQGDLIIDKSYFAPEIADRAAFDEEPWRAYNALPSAFLVDGRKTSFRFSVKNGTLQIQQEVPLPAVKIINEVKLTQHPCDNWRGNLTYDVSHENEEASVKFSGTFPENCDEKYLELSVLSDEQYAFLIFKKLWAELGGGFSGKLGTTIALSPPVQATIQSITEQPFVTQNSEPLGSVIRDINKWSNNLMARQLLLTLAAERYAVPATAFNGMLAIKNWLGLQGINSDSLVIENGAGLSRIERLTAQFLGEMLVSAYHKPTMPELMASLPILSVDGTTQRRLNGTLMSGRAHLKTGSIEGVSTIAGYVLSANNQRYVLVMLVNDAKAYASRPAQDAMIDWVYAQP